jgi:hypothetical protein
MNFNNILTATHAAVVAGNTTADAARAAFPLIVKAGSSIAALLRMDREGMLVTRAVTAGQRTIAGGLRAILAAEKVDVANRSAVRNALRVAVWADEGYSEPLEHTKAAPLVDAQLLDYQKVSARLSRLAKAIVGDDVGAAQTVKKTKRLPSALVATIKAATKDADVSYADALAALKRVYGK